MNLRVWSRIAGFGLLSLVLGPLLFQASGEVPSGSVVYAASTTGGTLSGVTFTDEDVLAYDVDSDTWSVHMDGSAVGVGSSLKIDGLHVRGDGSVLFSLNAPATVGSLGVVDDSDVVEFVPQSGSATSGSLTVFFDGSDYGLTTAGEDVDAVALDNAGRLVISTIGVVTAGFGSAADEDLLLVDGQDLALYLDGSAVDLNSGPEDVVGVSIESSGAINITTLGNYSVPGASGGRSDIARCQPVAQAAPIVTCSWSTEWLASSAGFQAESLNGLSIAASLGGPSTTTTTTTTPTTTNSTSTTTTTPPSTTTSTATTSTTAPPSTTTTTTAPPASGAGSMYVVSTSSGLIGGVSFTDEDVMTVDENGVWSLHFDGSDLGILASQKLDGFALKPDGTVLFSLNTPGSLPGLGFVDDSDVIALAPTSLGQLTAGALSMAFDGSAFGLTSAGEDVDAVAVDQDGGLLISTSGSVSAGFGKAANEDVLLFDGSELSLFLDGSAVGLGSGPENIVGLAVHPSGAIQISTTGNYSVPGTPGGAAVAGGGNDVAQCLPITAAPISECVWVNRWDGGTSGYGAESIAALHSTAIVGYYTDFSEPLGPEWDLYHSIGHAGWGLRRPSAITIKQSPDAVSGGVLTITARMGTEGDETGLLVSGGMKLRFPQTYGQLTIRARTDPDPSEVTSGAVLLWPESNQHPRDGEIDVLESWTNRATRTPMESNLHWLRPGATEPYQPWDDLKAQVIHPGVDGTEWHIYQLEWRHDLVSVAIDGGPPVILSTNPSEIASWNMEPTIQLDAFDSQAAPGQQPTLTSPVRMEIDYVIVGP